MPSFDKSRTMKKMKKKMIKTEAAVRKMTMMTTRTTATQSDHRPGAFHLG